MLTGQPLFHAETLDAIDQKHLKGNWKLPPVITQDKAIKHLLEKLLATKREDRFQSAFEVSGALAGLGFSRPEFRERLAIPATSKTSINSVRRARLSAE